MSALAGRRRPDLPLSEIHDDLQPGDYWKIANLTCVNPTNLTGTAWFVVAPCGAGFAIGRLEKHTVREHDDGTISVRPSDGSSNSIKITGAHGCEWHGYIEHGVWSPC